MDNVTLYIAIAVAVAVLLFFFLSKKGKAPEAPTCDPHRTRGPGA